MARFNQAKSGPKVPNQPIVSTPSPTLRTGNNAPGFVRDAEGELFLLAVSNFVGKDTFYEKGVARDNRFTSLVHEVAVRNPVWLERFLPWLRNEANMRTASIVAAVEATKAQLEAPNGAIHGHGRKLVNSVLVRADEPGEALGYWLSTYPGKQIPKPIKRGVADAAARMFNERNTLKYDTASHGIRFGDVLELTHARPTKPYQKIALFKHLIDRRQGREGIPSSLTMLHKNAWLREQCKERPTLLLDSEILGAAGMTWEDALSLAGDKVNKGLLWESMIPNMGYMALLRNLRNFDQAGIGALSQQYVINKLQNPDEVAKSRQLPMRFLAAYQEVQNNFNWSATLERALNLSLRNVPSFGGRTLILVDQSPSMFPGYSFSSKTDSKISLADQAKIFGSALAMRAVSADLIQYGGSWSPVRVGRTDSLLKVLERFHMIDSTDTQGAVRANFKGHDRVIIVTDEQANWHSYKDVAAAVPANIPVITFNLAGYKVGHMESGTPTRITIGGLSDQAFKLLPVLESRAKGQWPF